MSLFFDNDTIYYIVEMSCQSSHKLIISKNLNKWKNVPQILGQTLFSTYGRRPLNSQSFYLSMSVVYVYHMDKSITLG